MDKDKDIFSKLVEKAKINKLSEREQRAMFLAVDTYVENNPIYIKDANAAPSPEKVNTKFGNKFTRPVPSPFTQITQTRFQAFISSWHVRSFQTAIAVFVIMIFGVGGSSIAAQNSLPGNFLYPIKVNINEGLKVVLLSGPARASYEVERVKTRIGEAKELVAQNKMTDEIQNELAVRVSSHVSSVQKDIDTLTQKGDLKVAFEISSDLENSLSETVVASAASINEIIEVPLVASVAVRESTEDQISDLQVNDESTKAIALAKFDAVKKIVQTIDEQTLATASFSATMSTTVAPAVSALSVSAPSTNSNINAKAKGLAATPVATTTVKSTDKLAEVRELLLAGEEKLNAQEYDSAFSLFKHAHDLAQQIQGATDVTDPTNPKDGNPKDPNFIGELL